MKVERIIVQPACEEEAKQALLRWRAKHPELWDKLREGDVILDHVHSEHGKMRLQYRVFLDPDDAASLDASDPD